MDIPIEVTLPPRGAAEFSQSANPKWRVLAPVAVYPLKTVDVVGMQRTGYVHVTGVPDRVQNEAFFRRMKNIWYDFVWHMKWRNDSTGLTRLWMRKGDETLGKLVINKSGPNLYVGMGAYMKLANYHTPAKGKTVSVIHDRIVRGKSAAAVAMIPLEGIQEFDQAT